MRKNTVKRTSIFLDLVSLAFIFSSVFVNLIINVEAYGLGREQLEQIIHQGVALTLFAAFVFAFVLNKIKWTHLIKCFTTFLLFEVMLNLFILPVFKFDMANNFLFDPAPTFITPTALLIDGGIFLFSLFACFIAHTTLKGIQRSPSFKLSLFFFLLSVCFLYVQFNEFNAKYPVKLELEAFNDSRTFLFDPKETNTLVIIPDGFSGSEFSSILKEEPALKEKLSGFTFYKNTLAIHAGTWASAPQMVGGPNFALPKIEGTKKVWFSVYGEALGNLETKLKVIGKGLSFDDRWQYKNVSSNAYFFNGAFLFSFIKVGPSFIKDLAYTTITKSLAVDVLGKQKWNPLLNFYEHIEVGANKDVKIIHPQVPHPSNFMPKECVTESRAVNYVAVTYSEEARCFIRYLLRMNEKLKSLGVYDNTEIIIVSDHGWIGHSSDFADDMKDFGEGSWQSRRDPGLTHSLLLIKPARAKSAFEMDETHFMSNIDLYSILCGKHNHCSEMDWPFDLKDRVLNYYISTTDYHLKEAHEVRNNPFHRANWKRIR